MGIWAAAVCVPLLLLLYFLKLKRRQQVVSSTLLWKRAVQDLQVNAPFQKIRRNILLLLQMLMLIALLLALAGPALPLIQGPGNRFVLLIDRSAGMSATDVEPSRLGEAKKQAEEFVRSLRGKTLFSLRDDSDQLMVIAFDDHAKVMSNFTSDKRQLIAGIDAIKGSDGGSQLAEAITVARAFAQSPGTEVNDRSAETPAKLILFSDGRIRDLDEIIVSADELIFNSIGESAGNIAITAMQARRSYEDPEKVEVFAAITNYFPEQKTCEVQLSLNGNVQAVKSITLEAGRSDSSDEDVMTTTVPLSFELTHPGEGIIELRILESDYLEADNAAWSVLSPPRKLSILVVTNGNAVLESALGACPVDRLEFCSPEQFDSMDHIAMAADQPYDIIVLDNHVPESFPRCRFIVFGRPPDGIDITLAGQSENQFIMDWRQNHPVMKYVNLNNLFVAKSNNITLPRDADILAEFNNWPAVGLLRRNGSVFLLVGFDVLQSNWPFEPGFVMFCYNATTYLGVQLGEDQKSNLKIGDPIIIEGLVGEVKAKITGPGISDESIKANSSGTIRLPKIEQAGIYTVEIADQPVKVFSANMLNSDESRIEPVPEITLSGEVVEAKKNSTSRPNIPLWPYLGLFVLVVACVEWIVYNSKVRI